MAARQLPRVTMQEGTGLSPASSVDEALETILCHVARLPAEDVPLLEAAGRVLATDLEAPADLWPFARAAMDGFAVRSEDVAAASPAHPVMLPVLGEVFAGATPEHRLAAGTAMRIATGAPVPGGADSVIPFEQVHEAEDSVLIQGPVPSGKHIFPAGEDARKGEVVLEAGTVLRGGSLALLASLGFDHVRVVRRCRAAILAVGDELVESGPVRSGQVRESNSYALAAVVQEIGGIPWRLGIARDDIDDLVRELREGLGADALIVSAGVSVGERDLVKQALQRLGVGLLFWRVPMKPGSPVAFGLAGSTPVFGLPGTPGAAMVAFEELVRPALLAMMGHRTVRRIVHTATLGAPFTVKPGRRRFLWARASAGAGGLVVRPLRGQGTAALRSVSDANALIIGDPATGEMKSGDRVQVQLLGDPNAADDATRVPRLAVVGAKGAGKTLVIERLVLELRRRGYRVGVIKHDAHGFEIDQEGTDTRRATAAGADVVAIAGPDKAAVIYRTAHALTLGEVEEMVRGTDLILVEGFSGEPIPKIVVRRRGIVSTKPAPGGPVFAVVSDDGLSSSYAFDQITPLADRIEKALLCDR